MFTTWSLAWPRRLEPTLDECVENKILISDWCEHYSADGAGLLDDIAVRAIHFRYDENSPEGCKCGESSQTQREVCNSLRILQCLNTFKIANRADVHFHDCSRVKRVRIRRVVGRISWKRRDIERLSQKLERNFKSLMQMPDIAWVKTRTSNCLVFGKIYGEIGIFDRGITANFGSEDVVLPAGVFW